MNKFPVVTQIGKQLRQLSEKSTADVQTKRKKTQDEENLEIAEEFYTKNPLLTFSEYQQAVMSVTKNWPINNPDAVMDRIIYLAQAAKGGNKQAVVVQIAHILRCLAETADYIPIGLERIANLSLMDLSTGKAVGSTEIKEF